jgi:hypothetical protein
MAHAISVARETWRRYWPNINLVLGIVTTLLVITAWVTNLVSKRDATIFGGSLTVVGMTIAILHYRYQTREGRANIQPTFALSLLPNSILAIVRAGFPLNTQVVESAFRQAHGRQVILLYLTETQTINPGFMVITDQAMHNDEAQDLFRLARRLGGPTAQVFYKIGTTASAAEIWRVSRSREVVCDVDTASEFAQIVAPVYIRYQRQGKDTVAHIIMRKRGESALPGPAQTPPAPATPTGQRSTQAARYNDTAEVNDETWVEEFRDFDPRYADSRRPLHRTGATTGPRPQPVFAEPPRPDHKHDGDTEPRYPVKIKELKGPQQPPVIEPPRPAPLPRTPQRTSEPTPVETDDDSWLLNVDDVPYHGQNNQSNTTGDH